VPENISAEIIDDDTRAAGREKECVFTSDSPSSSCHDCDPAIETDRVVHSLIAYR
jgi:hypothetical protein